MHLPGASRRSSAALVVLLFAGSLLPASVLAATLATTRVVAGTGDPSPDGTGTLFEIVPPIVLGAAGQVVFYSDIRDQGFLVGTGIFRAGSPADLTLIARSSGSLGGPVTGWPAPDGNGNFTPFDTPPFAINASDHVAFGAHLAGTLDPAEDEGIFVGSGGQAGLVQIARGHELLPGGVDRITGLGVPGAAPSLNDAGEVSFTATVSGTPTGQAVLRGDGTPGSLIEIARTEPFAPGSLINFRSPAPIDQTGEVAFAASFSTGGGGIFRRSGNQVTEIAHNGEPSPDGNGSFGFDVGLRAPRLDDAGEVAFYTMLTGTTGGNEDDQGLFVGDGASLVVIARRGDLTPGGNGRLLDIDPDALVLNAQGQLLFTSTITGAQDGSSAGVFRGDGQSLLAIARLGQPTPIGVGVFSQFEPLTLALNDAGQVVFQAFVDLGDGGDTKDSEGLFLFDDARGLVELARIGDVVPGTGTIDALDFTGGTKAQGAGTSGLNASGEVAVHLAAGGNFYVAVVPEPKARWLGATAEVALLGLGLARRAVTPGGDIEKS